MRAAEQDHEATDPVGSGAAGGAADRAPTISVVTPTLRRPEEVEGLLENLRQQKLAPIEHIIVDAADEADMTTESIALAADGEQPWPIRHVRNDQGTAIQRNVGIDLARGEYVAFIDDDIRLDPDCFAELAATLERDDSIGGVAAYITNQHLDPERSPRWRLYRALRLFSTYEPGRFDTRTGYPINRYLQPPHDAEREIDFFGTSCALWRREVFDAGLRFSEFFTGYGVLEDAHLALRAGRDWRLVEVGAARCTHLRSPKSRTDSRRIARMTAVNYRFVFTDIIPDRTLRQEFRFWLVQLVDLLRFCTLLARRPGRSSLGTVVGKVEGMAMAATLRRRLDEADDATSG